eukprot:TRINITY_DN8639_c0_g1_i1.p1 TRINITY_DN8639_c0_g1~~TRINITY_DN8639_c0_g1_i1.p1  ORF type:complete len:185 (-),score=29.66 TRINITY_DN8639_c0_g1_i1:306-860(-)
MDPDSDVPKQSIETELECLEKQLIMLESVLQTRKNSNLEQQFNDGFDRFSETVMHKFNEAEATLNTEECQRDNIAKEIRCQKDVADSHNTEFVEFKECGLTDKNRIYGVEYSNMIEEISNVNKLIPTKRADAEKELFLRMVKMVSSSLTITGFRKLVKLMSPSVVEAIKQQNIQTGKNATPYII